jgi:hypothetical protein
MADGKPASDDVPDKSSRRSPLCRPPSESRRFSGHGDRSLPATLAFVGEPTMTIVTEYYRSVQFLLTAFRVARP